MESLGLTYKLVDLKIKVKHLTKSTLCLKYFRNRVIVMTKGKNRKIKIRKLYLFFLPHLPSQDRPPPPPIPLLLVKDPVFQREDDIQE